MKRLGSLAAWLERHGHAGAAAGLGQGVEETFTVYRLGPFDAHTVSPHDPCDRVRTAGSVRVLGA
jgi:hypothetical protein